LVVDSVRLIPQLAPLIGAIIAVHRDRYAADAGKRIHAVLFNQFAVVLFIRDFCVGHFAAAGAEVFPPSIAARKALN
jgi:hypothetical protein